MLDIRFRSASTIQTHAQIRKALSTFLVICLPLNEVLHSTLLDCLLWGSGRRTYGLCHTMTLCNAVMMCHAVTLHACQLGASVSRRGCGSAVDRCLWRLTSCGTGTPKRLQPALDTITSCDNVASEAESILRARSDLSGDRFEVLWQVWYSLQCLS